MPGIRLRFIGAVAFTTRKLTPLFALLALACGAEKNHGQRDRAAADRAARDVELDAGPPEAGCIRSCIPDPGSAPVDCALAESGIEFMDPPIWTFEETSFSYYSYWDNSAPKFYREREPMELCGRKDNHVLHMKGGPFAGWGGGMGVSMKDWWNSHKPDSKQPPPSCTSPGSPAPCQSIGDDATLSGHVIDASQYDGIALWARRGPESQDGIRVMVGDKYTDDDLNVDQDVGEPNNDMINTEQRYCRRLKRCDCPSNRPCNDYDEGGGKITRLCYDPAHDVVAGTDTDNTARVVYLDQNNVQLDYCGQPACDQPYQAGGKDPAFKGHACTPYQFKNGVNGSYCFNPGSDPPPAESYELCGDHWQKPIRLSTDWQLFLVPFSDMRQQGYGKESPGLLVDQISIARMTWEGGWIDYYIDDVRFYRVKR